jgi:hypothetical protein
MAADIFVRLVKVTGSYDVTDQTLTTAPSAQQFAAIRMLAQLAANIVDFIDTDDIMTPFNWAPPATVPAGTPVFGQLANGTLINQPTISKVATYDPLANGWVLGTELPRLVLNEVYSDIRTNPADIAGKKAVNPYIVTFWAELHNPFKADPTLPDTAILADPNPTSLVTPNSLARLQYKGMPTSVYRVAIQQNAPGVAPDPYLRDPSNMFGNWNPSNFKTVVSSFATPDAPNTTCDYFVVQPNDTYTGTPTPQTNNGFYVLGPANKYESNPPPGITGLQLATFQVQDNPGSGMTYTYPVGPVPTNLTSAVLLQRLACPYLPPNPTPPGTAASPYNPYITVDYVDNVLANQAVQYDNAGNPQMSPNPASVGRMQPYAADSISNLKQQQNAAVKPQNTFYGPNTPAANPFNWLVHLDRQLVSAMELLQVSGYRPHELTQLFNSPASGFPLTPSTPPTMAGQYTQCYYGHRVPWFDEDLATVPGQSHRLYRLFEFLESGNRAAGMTPGGRIPGMLNINTVWDIETLMAHCDPQQGNSNAFDTGAVQSIFTTIRAMRSTGAGFYPGQIDRPFWSLAAGTYPVGDPQFQSLDAMGNPTPFGLNNTLLRSATAGGKGNSARLFQGTISNPPNPPNPPSHPYLQDQLLAKLFNNVTTRSNVFAVWLTVGFFEVTDATTKPVKLGAEIGKAQNRQIRHRMFAIIDRTSLATEKYNPTTLEPPPVFVNGSSYAQSTRPTDPANSWIISVPDGQYPFLPPPAPPLPPDTKVAFLKGSYDAIPWNIQAPVPGNPPVLGTNVLIDSGPNQELVNVISVNTPPGSGLPPTITISNPTKGHTAPFAITPVNTVSGYTAVTAGATAPFALVASALDYTQGGLFEGTNWSFSVGTVFQLDVGSAQETAVVVSMPTSPNGLGFQSTSPTGFQNAHPQVPNTPYTISYPIPVLGNPGPQPNLNVRQVPWVVRYLSIIN